MWTCWASVTPDCLCESHRVMLCDSSGGKNSTIMTRRLVIWNNTVVRCCDDVAFSVNKTSHCREEASLHDIALSVCRGLKFSCTVWLNDFSYIRWRWEQVRLNIIRYVSYFTSSRKLNKDIKFEMQKCFGALRLETLMVFESVLQAASLLTAFSSSSQLSIHPPSIFCFYFFIPSVWSHSAALLGFCSFTRPHRSGLFSDTILTLFLSYKILCFLTSFPENVVILF